MHILRHRFVIAGFCGHLGGGGGKVPIVPSLTMPTCPPFFH
jgi:hypothetical protein